MKCKSCGYEMPGDSIFCPNCGEKNVGKAPVQSENIVGFFTAPNDLGGSIQSQQATTPAERTAKPSPTTTSGIRFSSSFTPAGAVIGENSANSSTTKTNEFVKPAPTIKENSHSHTYVSTETIATANQKSAQCANCGAGIPLDSQFCPVCGKPAAGGSKPSSKKKTILIASIASAAVLLIAVVISAILLNMANGPINKIYSSLNNTLSAKSFSANVSVYNNGSLSDGYSVQASINPNKKEITAIIRPNNANYVVAIYNGYLIYYSNNFYGEGTYAYKQDISENLVSYFDEYSKNKSDFNNLDIAEILNSIDESGYLYRSANKTFDLDALSACAKSFLKQLNDEKWLSENAGYREAKDGNSVTYYFDLNNYVLPQFLNASLETFKPAFRSMDSYYSMKDDIAYMDQHGSAYADLKFVVEGKYLTSATIAIAADIYNAQSIVVNFSNIGTTSIDTEQLAYWLSIAEN